MTVYQVQRSARPQPKATPREPAQPTPDDHGHSHGPSAAEPPAAPPQKSLTELSLELCNDPEQFAAAVQEIVKDRGGRLGVAAAQEDLELVCSEVRAAHNAINRPGRGR